MGKKITKKIDIFTLVKKLLLTKFIKLLKNDRYLQLLCVMAVSMMRFLLCILKLLIKDYIIKLYAEQLS